MTGQTEKPHPTPGVWRTRVWQSKRSGGWEYQMYLSDGGDLGGVGYATEADARRALALHYYTWFGVHSDHLLARADKDWPTTARYYRPQEQKA